MRLFKRGGGQPVEPAGGEVSAPVTDGNDGWCACCRSQTHFTIHGDWLRDQYVCDTCGSIPRLRAVNLALDTYFEDWADLAIHESSPGSDFVSRYCSDYSSSFYFEDVPLGEVRDGKRCENLEQLTFDDETFDIVVTQDVFEHVFDPGSAAREIMRVLKPGGAHVFTTPKYGFLETSIQRAALRDGEIDYLVEPPSYHGNPIGDGRALVTWDYGRDFEALLWEWCAQPTVTYVTRDRALGLDGEHLELFITRKVR